MFNLVGWLLGGLCVVVPLLLVLITHRSYPKPVIDDEDAPDTIDRYAMRESARERARFEKTRKKNFKTMYNQIRIH